MSLDGGRLVKSSGGLLGLAQLLEENTVLLGQTPREPASDTARERERERERITLVDVVSVCVCVCVLH